MDACKEEVLQRRKNKFDTTEGDLSIIAIYCLKDLGMPPSKSNLAKISSFKALTSAAEGETAVYISIRPSEGLKQRRRTTNTIKHHLEIHKKPIGPHDPASPNTFSSKTTTVDNADHNECLSSTSFSLQTHISANCRRKKAADDLLCCKIEAAEEQQQLVARLERRLECTTENMQEEQSICQRLLSVLELSYLKNESQEANIEEERSLTQRLLGVVEESYLWSQAQQSRIQEGQKQIESLTKDNQSLREKLGKATGLLDVQKKELKQQTINTLQFTERICSLQQQLEESESNLQNERILLKDSIHREQQLNVDFETLQKKRHLDPTLSTLNKTAASTTPTGKTSTSNNIAAGKTSNKQQ